MKNSLPVYVYSDPHKHTYGGDDGTLTVVAAVVVVLVVTSTRKFMKFRRESWY